MHDDKADDNDQDSRAGRRAGPSSETWIARRAALNGYRTFASKVSAAYHSAPCESGPYHETTPHISIDGEVVSVDLASAQLVQCSNSTAVSVWPLDSRRLRHRLL